MKPETKTLGIGMLSFAAFLLSNLFPHVLPSIGKFLVTASPSQWIILLLAVMNLTQTALLFHKHKNYGKTSRF